VYNVVSNVNEYQHFIPFCTHSKVYTSKLLSSQQTVMQAELGIGFKLFKEKYMSTVTCQEPHMVTAVSSDASLFKELITTWKFLPHQTNQQKCIVDFSISFEFASPLHAQASNVFFDQVSKMMMKAFIDRCHQVYNPSATK
ncbi:cyclase/dehydrase, partial [Cunninghamella echinulata]